MFLSQKHHAWVVYDFADFKSYAGRADVLVEKGFAG
jgi:hypothetical protein